MAYDEGQGVKINYRKAASYYEQAIKYGDTRAMFNLGIMYVRGDGFSKSFNKAAELMLKAAPKGDVKAQYVFGLLHVSNNYSLGGKRIKAAADACDQDAIKWIKESNQYQRY